MTREEYFLLANECGLPAAIYAHPGVRDLVRKAVLLTREECAQVCEAESRLGIDDERAYCGELMAAAIRARGQA